VPFVPSGSDTSFLVLHGLRLKGFADTPSVVDTTGLAEPDVAAALDAAQAEGLVTRREGRVSGWSLTPGGRARHAEQISAELDGSGARDAIHAAYKQFLGVNGELLSVCTDWQLRNGSVNDHTDPAYDEKIIGRLREVNTTVQPVCTELAAALDRFAGYGPRLARALERVEAGDRDWFAKPMIDSYHTIWFELHEDLLVTLGIERSKESVG
jgi:hypothetical protein